MVAPSEYRPISRASVTLLIAIATLGAPNVPRPVLEPSQGDGGVSAFYVWDKEVPGTPGKLLRQEPLPDSLMLSNASKSLRVLYTSTNGIDGKTPIAVSGAIYFPKRQATSGGWPVVAWDHGTTGVADVCAPSWTPKSQRDTDYLNAWLAQGYAIVATDYQGLGTPGGHPVGLTVKPEASLRLGIGYRRLAIILRTATPADGYVISDVPVPMVAGLFWPVILMPRSADSWSSSQRAAAPKHEQAHVERHDLWTSLVAHFARVIYWFHPLAWVVASRLRQEQENACDDAVLCSGFEPAEYDEALIATARHAVSNSLIGCHMTRITLKSRIARLLESGLAHTSSAATLRGTAMVFAVAITAIALLNGNPQARAADGRVYTMSDGVSPPRVLQVVDPVYTEEARTARVSGEVLLQIVVDTEGHARDIQVAKSLGMGLDEKAVEAVGKWTFAPGTKDGLPVNVRARIAVNFRLQ
jgi:TonB family protein